MGRIAVSGIRFLICTIAVIYAVDSIQAQTQKKEKKDFTDSGKGNFLWNHTPRSRDFHAVGHSLFLDLNLSPIQTYAPDTISNPLDTTTKFSRIAEYSIYHISYFLRFNVLQPDDEKAVTLTLNPGIGAGFSQSKRVKGFGIFTGGAYLGYEWGNGSTYRSAEEKGAFIRLGAEYNYTPLIISKRSREESDIKTWITPAIMFGTRKANYKGRLIETNMKIGWGLEKVKEEGNALNPYTFARPFSCRFSLVVFLDY